MTICNTSCCPRRDNATGSEWITENRRDGSRLPVLAALTVVLTVPIVRIERGVATLRDTQTRRWKTVSRVSPARIAGYNGPVPRNCDSLQMEVIDSLVNLISLLKLTDPSDPGQPRCTPPTAVNSSKPPPESLPASPAVPSRGTCLPLTANTPSIASRWRSGPFRRRHGPSGLCKKGEGGIRH